MKNYIKAFIAGLAFPAAFYSIVYTIALLSGFSPFLTYPLQLIPLWIPWVFGLWNVLHVMFEKQLPKNQKNRYWMLGISLGLLVASFGIVVVKLPVILFGLRGMYQLFPLIVVPIAYGLIWRYIVTYLNKILGVKNC